MRRLMIYCAIGFLQAAAPGQAPFTVDWAGERLTVRATEAPLAQVIAEVARLTGVEVVGLDKLTGRISADVAGMSREQALAALLTDVNYVLQMKKASADGPARLVLLVHSMSGTAPPAALANPPLQVPVLEALAALETAEEAEDRLAAEDDDPETEETKRDDLLEASRLASEGAFGPDADLSNLIEYMDDSNKEVRLEALRGLARRPMKDGLKAISAALADDSLAVSRAAIDILGHARDAESLRAVGALAEKHPDIAMRLAAMRVFALRADPASAVHLRAALKDRDETMRLAASQMLADLERRARAAQARQER